MELKAPQWAINFVQEWGFVKYQGKTFVYMVLGKDCQPELKGFMGFVPYPSFLYISEEVPLEYRKIVLRYELRKWFRYSNMGLSYRRSLQVEVKEVPVNKREEYYKWRIACFKQEYWYHTLGPGHRVAHEGQVYEIRGCILFLESLLGLG